MRKRIRINSYGASKSARLLSKYIGANRLLMTGSRFVGKNSDVVINWGNGNQRLHNIGNARQINKLYNVQLASNKLKTLEALKARRVSIPYFSTYKESFAPVDTLVCRTTLYGHSGQGIVVGLRDEVCEAPLYVEYIEKVAEYRVIVVGGEVVDFKKKKRRNGYDGVYGEHVWNHSSGYIFARNNFIVPSNCGRLGVSAVVALGLDFGAVDIIEDREGTLYVLEVNTAFGIEGTTLQLVGDAIKEIL